MPAPRGPTVTQFARRLAIETPEHLVLELELAGVGSRVAAAACDAVLLGGVYLAVALGLGTLATRRDTPWSSLVEALFFAALFCLFWGYFLLFEAFNHGRTPGKVLLGIRVVMDTGHPITLAAAAVRNLMRAVDMLPVPLVGLVFM
ncbi:MAG TPA: RDD family protein, partial [Gemmatimonadales bacterium]|nr:RDD family protein [Gemmatimonadales bacterium]